MQIVLRATAGTIACLLCGTGCMNSHNARCHFASIKHAKKHAKVKRIEDSIKKERGPLLVENLEWCKKFEKNIEFLGLRRWKLEIKSQMMTFLCSHTDS